MDFHLLSVHLNVSLITTQKELQALLNVLDATPAILMSRSTFPLFVILPHISQW